MQQFYLAPDEEITSVIERLRASESSGVVLVVPKGVSLMQSIINVRLLKKKADEMGKDLGLVSNDPICKHLAGQVGLKIYNSIQEVPKSGGDAKPAAPIEVPKRESKPVTETISGEGIGSIKVSHYRNEPTEDEISVDDDVQEPEDLGEHEHTDVPVEANQAAEPTEEDPIIEGTNIYLENDRDGADDQRQTRHEATRVNVASPKGLHRPPIKVPRWVKPVVALIIIIVLAGAVGAALLLPKATIVLHVPSEAVKSVVNVTADAKLTAASDQSIPAIAHDATADGQGTAKATGKKNVGNKAKGVITISNSWSSDAQVIAKGSGLVSDKGLVFRTLADTSVPGASSSISNGQVVVNPGKVDVAVEADQPGDQYNIDNARFTVQGFSGDKASKITGVSKGTASGGTNQVLTVVANADVTAAKADAKTKAEADALAALKQAIPQGEVLIDKSVAYTTEVKDPDKKSGDQSDAVNVTATSKAAAYSAKTSDVLQVITTSFKASVPENKELRLDAIDLSSWETTTKSEGVFALSHEVTGLMVAKIDTKSVAKLATIKQSSSLSSSLKDKYNANSVQVSINPGWWPLTPVLNSKISVEIAE